MPPACLLDFLANDKGVPREQVKSWTPYPGGAPANVATCLAKLGVKTAFVSALGKDDRGEELMKLFDGQLPDDGVIMSVTAYIKAPVHCN
jgi:fructokinase